MIVLLSIDVYIGSNRTVDLVCIKFIIFNCFGDFLTRIRDVMARKITTRSDGLKNGRCFFEAL